MKLLFQYIWEILGTEIYQEAIDKKDLGMLPLFLSETYRLYHADLFNQPFILVENLNPEDFSIQQTLKHFELIKEVLNKKVVLLAQEISALNRKRLIEKGINFIVPGKQLYLPDWLIDLRENFRSEKNTGNKETLLPSAQLIVLYRILHRQEKKKIEELTFKELALKLSYTPMAITYAAENLKYHEICTIEGKKGKYFKFNLEISEMWFELEKRKLLTNPVIKKVFVDQKPKDTLLLLSNTSALPEYTDMNPGRQEFYAIEKKLFYDLQIQGALVNKNDHEGKCCLEVWKYNPNILAVIKLNDIPVVDPLSLYLSLKNNYDERIEMALEQIIKKNIW